MTGELLDEMPETTAVVAANDRLALGAIDAIRDNGQDLPRGRLGGGLQRHALQRPVLTTTDHGAHLAVRARLDGGEESAGDDLRSGPCRPRPNSSNPSWWSGGRRLRPEPDRVSVSEQPFVQGDGSGGRSDLSHDAVLLGNMTQPEAEEALARGTAVLVTGSIEQHGGHLPLGTDAFAALTIALRVGERLAAPVLPLTPVGVAPYHLSWPGTLSVRPETLAALIVDVCEGLALAGVERVVIVNWHEGNSTAIRLGADTRPAATPVAGPRRRVARGHQFALSRRDGIHPRRIDGDGGGPRPRSRVGTVSTSGLVVTRWIGRPKDTPCSGGATCSRSCWTSGRWRRRAGMGHRTR